MPARRLAPAGLLAVVTAVLLAAGVAHGAATIGVSDGFETDGQPQLSASISSGSSATVTWSICPGGGSCTSAGQTGPTFAPGESPAGTVFQADATVDGQPVSGRSAAWRGRITATIAPMLSGTPVAGSTLTPRGATWSGGWPDDTSGVYVQVCDTADGQGCINTEPFCGGPPRGRAYPLTDADVGKYVQTIDYRLRGGMAYPQICQVSGNGGPGRAPGQTVAASPLVGPVTRGATTPNPPPVSPGPGSPEPTKVAVAVAGTPRIGTGAGLRVTCAGACTIGARLAVSATTARSHHLTLRTVATGKASRTSAGRSTLRLTLTRAARHALRRATRVRATLRVTVREGGKTTAVSRAVTLKR